MVVDVQQSTAETHSATYPETSLAEGPRFPRLEIDVERIAMKLVGLGSQHGAENPVGTLMKPIEKPEIVGGYR